MADQQPVLGNSNQFSLRDDDDYPPQLNVVSRSQRKAGELVDARLGSGFGTGVTSVLRPSH